jgi:molecular chaperone DnaK
MSTAANRSVYDATAGDEGVDDGAGVVLGIDLGTTFSAMAVVNRFGKPEMVMNSEGHPTTASVIHFYDEDSCVVGEEAVKMVVIDPNNVVRFIKRHMGEDQFTLDFYGRTYSPQEISALILRKLKDDAEELLGEPIRDAVVTVPAYFNSAQRGATAEAGALAGLNVLSIINEPTAAAIAYGLDRLGTASKLLVFDLGGGTFDVTVMRIDGARLSTIASDGNAELGGKDWDDRLVNHVAEEFISKYQLDPRDDAVAYQELYERCLYAKITLSTKDRAVVPVNFRGHRMVSNIERKLFEQMSQDLVDQCEHTSNIVLEKAGMKWSDLDEVLLVGGSTRMPMIRDLMRRLSGKEPAAGVNPDECVALGAALAGVFRHRPNHPALRATRQRIQQRSSLVPVDATSAPPPPERMVAPKPVAPAPMPAPAAAPRRGAAIRLADGGHGDDLGHSDVGELPDVTIEDATTHPLGLIVLDKSRVERVIELVPEGTRLPHEFRGRFAYAYENMTAVRVEVTEGVGELRDEVTVIGKVELTGLPPRPRGTPIEVIYSYGVDQILMVQVIDVESGVSRQVQIRFLGGLSGEQMAAARERQRAIVVD